MKGVFIIYSLTKITAAQAKGIVWQNNRTLFHGDPMYPKSFTKVLKLKKCGSLNTSKSISLLTGPDVSLNQTFIRDALRDLLPFVQFKKHEKKTWESDNFRKVASSSLQLY